MEEIEQIKDTEKESNNKYNFKKSNSIILSTT
jgi:hypothetical protein